MTGNKVSLVQQFKYEMMEVFDMTDLGLMSYFLGMEIQKNDYEVFIFQKKYAKEILKKFKLEECKGMSTPMNSKEKPKKEDGVEKVDEAHFRSLVGCLILEV